MKTSARDAQPDRGTPDRLPREVRGMAFQAAARRRARPAILAAVLMASLAGCGEPTGPGAGADQLLFTSSRAGVMQGSTPMFDIFRMNADGSGEVNLTNRPGRYHYLALTPDGRTVVYEYQPDLATWDGVGCALQVWSVGVDGTERRQVTNGECSYMPRLSPDGRHVAFLRGNTVWVVGTDGSGARLVSGALPAVQPNACGELPKVMVRTLGWASASRLQFERHICLEGTTYHEVDTQGSGLAAVDYNASVAYLSPDGSRIAYVRNPYILGGSELVVMNADGSNSRTIATAASLPSRHSLNGTVWSPDGSEIYFYTSTGHFVTGADGSATRRLAPPWPEWRGGFQSWSPDGSRVAFALLTDTRSDVVVMNADGTGLVNLTAGTAGSSSQPLWVPR